MKTPTTNCLHSKDFLLQLNSSNILFAFERRPQLVSHKNEEQLASQPTPLIRELRCLLRGLTPISVPAKIPEIV